MPLLPSRIPCRSPLEVHPLSPVLRPRSRRSLPLSSSSLGVLRSSKLRSTGPGRVLARGAPRTANRRKSDNAAAAVARATSSVQRSAPGSSSSSHGRYYSRLPCTAVPSDANHPFAGRALHSFSFSSCEFLREYRAVLSDPMHAALFCHTIYTPPSNTNTDDESALKGGGFRLSYRCSLLSPLKGLDASSLVWSQSSVRAAVALASCVSPPHTYLMWGLRCGDNDVRAASRRGGGWPRERSVATRKAILEASESKSSFKSETTSIFDEPKQIFRELHAHSFKQSDKNRHSLEALAHTDTEAPSASRE